MRSKLIIFAISSALMLSACGGETPNTNTGSNSPKPVNINANVTATNTNEPITTNTRPVAETTNDAPTLKPVVEAYYAALKNKDEAAVRKVLSAALIKEDEESMKEEKSPNLIAYITSIDRVPEKVEVRNEKIAGDKGVAEIKGGAYPNWTPLAFVREGGAWKISNENPDIDAVTKGK